MEEDVMRVDNEGGEGGAGRGQDAPDGDGEGDGVAREGSTASDEEEEQFDISLAASHSYMGGGLQPVSGRSILEAGWTGRVPVLGHHGAVFPGEIVPMLLTDPHDAEMLKRAINNDKLFGLLCPDESGTMVSGYGVLCEVFEAAIDEDEPRPLTFKARANHRFRFRQMPDTYLPMQAYDRVRMAEVVVLPEIVSSAPLQRIRLTSLDPYRRPRTPLDRQLRSMDASLTSWPLFVYEIFDYDRMRKIIQDYFKTLSFDRLPEDPVCLSFWVARNLTLSARDRLALFYVDNALLRLHMEVRDIARKSVLCCCACSTEIARREHVFAMSSDGVHANYTNLGGYMHDIVTVSVASNTLLTGSPSAEYSWFPGYTWTIAVCAACMAHVGWRFDATRRALRPQRFYALCRNYVSPRPEGVSTHNPRAPSPAPSPRYPIFLRARTHRHQPS